METNNRFRPSLRQYRILEAANKELKESYDIAKVNLDIACDGIKFYKEAIDTKNKDLCKALAMVGAWKTHCVSFKKNGNRAIRLNWYLLALIVAQGIFLIVR